MSVWRWHWAEKPFYFINSSVTFTISWNLDHGWPRLFLCWMFVSHSAVVSEFCSNKVSNCSCYSFGKKLTLYKTPGKNTKPCKFIKQLTLLLQIYNTGNNFIIASTKSVSKFSSFICVAMLAPIIRAIFIKSKLYIENGSRKKSPPEKSPADPKPNPISNITLTLPLDPSRGDFFPGGGFFPDTIVNMLLFEFWMSMSVLETFSHVELVLFSQVKLKSSSLFLWKVDEYALESDFFLLILRGTRTTRHDHWYSYWGLHLQQYILVFVNMSVTWQEDLLNYWLLC